MGTGSRRRCWVDVRPQDSADLWRIKQGTQASERARQAREEKQQHHRSRRCQAQPAAAAASSSPTAHAQRQEHPPAVVPVPRRLPRPPPSLWLSKAELAALPAHVQRTLNQNSEPGTARLPELGGSSVCGNNKGGSTSQRPEWVDTSHYRARTHRAPYYPRQQLS